MARTHRTNANGVTTVTPFTAQEESDWDAKEATFAAGEEDRAWNYVRKHRNKMLISTDFTQTADYPNASSFREYRQALRNLPQGAYTGIQLRDSYIAKTRIDNPVDDGKWPDKPGGDN